jgi:aminoglycoside phosphotransferase (APT) family kinase protein
METPDRALDAFLVAHGLAEAGERPRWQPLAGGVSSDIWRVDLRRRSLCVKRALPKLKVAADWQAPVDRNAYEWAWLEFAAGMCPGHVPTPVAHDAEAGLFAMEFLAAERHPVWKQQLLDGVVEPATAAAVGDVLGRVHAASAGRPEVAAAFDSTTNFHALRLEPYLLATAAHHPDLASALNALAERTAATRIALVHGDVSPKNILVGPQGPVFLDAECAWYGDPAFDLAFCLNHLLLKLIAQPARGAALRASFEALAQAYLPRVHWEAAAALETRAAALLPGLLLARCDGKSPVEYLNRDADRERLRAVARPLLLRPAATLGDVASAWFAYGQIT